MTYSETGGVYARYMRGGTSKGLIMHERDLPTAGPERDGVLRRMMGTPDPLQVDGMGGAVSSTSKVMIVGQPDADGVVPYAFAQVGIADAVVDWRGNCGNLSFAVAAFAVDEGLSPVEEGATTTTVRLRNTNTGVWIDADVSVAHGSAARVGDTVVAGVPGTAAPIVTRYRNAGGAVTGALLTFGAPQTELTVTIGGRELRVSVSLVDATNPYLFVAREAIPGADRPDAELRDDVAFLDAIERLRAEAAVRLGAAGTPESASVEAPVTPRVVLVAAADTGVSADIATLTVSMQRVHRGIPMSAAMCLAAARGVAGSVVHEIAGDAPEDGATVISHPLGSVRVVAEFARDQRAEHDGSTAAASLISVGVTGTARTLMRGTVYPRERSAEA